VSQGPAAPIDRFINCVRHSSGHVYFTLKDEASQVRCVAFREYAERLACAPTDGARILVHGAITVYERAGQYQLYVTEVVADGVGSLHLLFEQLKEKLRAEGLFDPARKRAIPAFPRRIAMVTSADGAVFHDFSVIARRRWPAVSIALVPAAVSGPAAAASIVRGLSEAAKLPDVDVIVVARGGGSLEELWPFNEEPVARAIARSPVPVVSAVGHETDFTIADFVADLRAPTPSAAAELLTPDAATMCAHAQRLRDRARQAVLRLLERYRRELRLLQSRRVLSTPAAALAEPRQRADDAMRRIRAALGQALERRRIRVSAAGERARALDPLAVIGRGYCVMRTPAGALVRTVSQLNPGDDTEVVLRDGSAWCEVERVVPRETELRGRAGRSRAQGEP
jgi:exodeoxyribonuclease VII large subunit